MAKPKYDYDPKKGSWALHRKLLRAPGVGFNAEVQAWFKSDTVTATRSALRDSLLILPKDSRTTAQYKIWYFREFVQKVQNKPDVIMDMTDRPFENFTHKPQITLYFYQSSKGLPEGQPPLKGEISYRLVNETSATLTETEVRARANKIKTIFTQPNLFVWKRGEIKYVYLDPANGYFLQILAINESEAKRIISAVLDIENKTPDWNLLKASISERESSTTVQTKTIYGKSRKVPRWRPRGDVKFRYAYIKIHGIPKPIYIVDCRFGEPIIKTAA